MLTQISAQEELEKVQPGGKSGLKLGFPFTGPLGLVSATLSPGSFQTKIEFCPLSLIIY